MLSVQFKQYICYELYSMRNNNINKGDYNERLLNNKLVAKW